MGFLNLRSSANKMAANPAPPAPHAAPKPPVVLSAVPGKVSTELSEQDRATLYHVAPIKNFRKTENILPGKDQSDSFFVVVDGTVQVFGVTDLPYGSPLVFGKGDVIGPIPPSAGVTFWIQALEPSVVIEVTPIVLANLPERFHVWIYRSTLRSYDRSARFMRAINRDIERKNRLLSQRWDYECAQFRDVTANPVVQNFIKGLPKLPAFATDLAVKLLDQNVAVKEVAEGLSQDPALAGIILRYVNSAAYGFHKRIDSYYHASMILGLNNIYRILMEEGMRQSLRKTADARKLQVHSCVISCLCHEIARMSEDVLPQSAITIGLMHDVGKTVVTLLTEKHPEIGPFARVLDTAKVGADLVQAWGLPSKISTSIQFQNQPEFTPPSAMEHDCKKEVVILHLAHVFEGMLSGNPMEAVRTPFANECCEFLKIAPGKADEVYKTKILPSLIKTRNKLPREVRDLVPTSTF